ncbi:5-formyltetrahydrofolate cyclo-ligase [Sphingosinicellaceae bacterium]|nr:5-formyltetrahydrofolate cyclo-ligase [Sphingosinicellaceae bacterium]
MVVPPTSPTRNELRALVRDIRVRFLAPLGDDERAGLDAALVERLRPLLDGRRKVAGYAAMHDEVDPAAIGFTTWPRVGANGEPLRFHHAHPDDLIRSPGWGIREPDRFAPLVEPDAILVPLVAADARGNRLGYGKGHYDRTLPLHDAVRIGVAFDCQVIDHVPAEAWDAPLDWLVTPTRTIRCTHAATLPPVGVVPGSG